MIDERRRKREREKKSLGLDFYFGADSNFCSTFIIDELLVLLSIMKLGTLACCWIYYNMFGNIYIIACLVMTGMLWV